MINPSTTATQDYETASQSPSYYNNYFTSEYAKSFVGTSDKFNAYQFHFHAGSEHTIEGKRYDFEMHLLHKPEDAKDSGVLAAVLGLIFDTKDYDKSITEE